MKRFHGIQLACMVLATAFLCIGCSPDVVVTDAEGNPVPKATVCPISLSVNHPPVLTDGSGKARIGRRVQSVKWIEVTGEGYHLSGHVPFADRRKPVSVILKRKEQRG